MIEAWRVDYNTQRPHSALGQQTPAAYAAAACAGPQLGWGACSAALSNRGQNAPQPGGLTLSV